MQQAIFTYQRVNKRANKHWGIPIEYFWIIYQPANITEKWIEKDHCFEKNTINTYK